MKNASPFLELEDGPTVRVSFEQSPLELPDGANLAAALLGAGIGRFRNTSISGAPRAPFCMMGACFECLVVVDGVTRQACMMSVRAGMEIERPDPTPPDSWSDSEEPSEVDDAKA